MHDSDLLEAVILCRFHSMIGLIAPLVLLFLRVLAPCLSCEWSLISEWLPLQNVDFEAEYCADRFCKTFESVAHNSTFIIVNYWTR